MYFEYYQNNSGQWRWRAKANNHETIGSGEAYTSKAGVENVIRIFKEEAAAAPVNEVER